MASYTTVINDRAYDRIVTVHTPRKPILLTLPSMEPSSAVQALFEELIGLARISGRTPVIFLGDIPCVVAADSDPSLLTLAYHYARQGYASYVPAHPRKRELVEFILAEAMAIYFLEIACNLLEEFVRDYCAALSTRVSYVEL